MTNIIDYNPIGTIFIGERLTFLPHNIQNTSVFFFSMALNTQQQRLQRDRIKQDLCLEIGAIKPIWFQY